MNEIDLNEPQLDLTAWHNAISECLRRYEERVTTFDEFRAEVGKVRRDAGFGYDIDEPNYEAE